ncbi:hypothetical protein JL720_11273 [Aureococcus anophagefferens]|nr:hypothetical protein JL720_11273 [Aureococcus anophagefferens]
MAAPDAQQYVAQFEQCVAALQTGANAAQATKTLLALREDPRCLEIAQCVLAGSASREAQFHALTLFREGALQRWASLGAPQRSGAAGLADFAALDPGAEPFVSAAALRAFAALWARGFADAARGPKEATRARARRAREAPATQPRDAAAAAELAEQVLGWDFSGAGDALTARVAPPAPWKALLADGGALTRRRFRSGARRPRAAPARAAATLLASAQGEAVVANEAAYRRSAAACATRVAASAAAHAAARAFDDAVAELRSAADLVSAVFGAAGGASQVAADVLGPLLEASARNCDWVASRCAAAGVLGELEEDASADDAAGDARKRLETAAAVGRRHVAASCRALDELLTTALERVGALGAATDALEVDATLEEVVVLADLAGALLADDDSSGETVAVPLAIAAAARRDGDAAGAAAALLHKVLVGATDVRRPSSPAVAACLAAFLARLLAAYARAPDAPPGPSATSPPRRPSRRGRWAPAAWLAAWRGAGRRRRLRAAHYGGGDGAARRARRRRGRGGRDAAAAGGARRGVDRRRDAAAAGFAARRRCARTWRGPAATSRSRSTL